MEKTLASRLAGAFNSPHMFATSLLLLLVDMFGQEVINWDIYTIRQELRDELNTTIPEITDQKIQAILSMLCSDDVLHDPLIFSSTARVLCNEPPLVDIVAPLDPDIAAWCLAEAAFLGVDDIQNGLSDSLKRYLGACLTYAGIHQVPRCMSQAILPDTDADPAEASTIDPDIQSAYIKRNQNETQDLDAFVNTRARQLIDQITRLPLQNRDNDSWAKFYSRINKALAA